MRLFFSVFISLFVSAVFFFTVKFWGQSQRYIDYNHAFYSNVQTPLVFEKSNAKTLIENLQSDKNLYLDIAITLDQQIVLPLESLNTKFRVQNFREMKQPAALMSDYAVQLKGRRLILNLIENPIAGPDIILNELKKMGFDKENNFVFTSPYDAQMKDLKEKTPAYLFGTTNPEILRIKSMESVYLMEASVFRSDIVIHPLDFYKQPFFTETLLADLKRRFKRFIVGPIKPEQIEEAKKLNPLGIIIQN
jgi:hypothetical protein